MSVANRILELVDRYYDGVVQLRRDLHRMAEPEMKEYRTAERLVAELDRLELDIETDVAGTGIIADLDTGRDGPCVIIRADMDALPVPEATGVDYCSTSRQYSHCCGHDGNMASVSAVARILDAMRDDMVGKVRFIFQPAEETTVGAMAMIEHGVLDIKPNAILAPHAWPGMPVGVLGCKAGAMMAGCDKFSVKVLGQGGHGARPHLARNPLRGMMSVVQAYETFHQEGVVVSLCQAHVGEGDNIIADAGVLSGTLRTLDEQVREETMRQMRQLAEDACTSLDMHAEVTFGERTPVVNVDAGVYDVFRSVTTDLLGGDAVTEVEPSMGSEDFGWYLQRVPGLMFRVGMGMDSPELHNAGFDYVDEALKSSMAVLAGMTLRLGLER